MEVCSLRDVATQFSELDADVFGLSLDGVADLAKFHKDQELNFPLLSDPDGSAAKKFGSLMNGRPYAARKTFVIDPKGILRYIDEGVQVKTHGEDLVALLKRLQAE